VDSILLVTNIGAGSADDKTLSRAIDLLRESRSVEVCVTHGPDELEDVLDGLGSRRLVIAGGDGSLHGVVAALNRRNQLKQTVLGLIPIGTGNDFARGAGIPLDPAEAARLILTGRIGTIDLVVDDAGDIVVNNVRVGIGAEASRKGRRWKQRLSRLGYAVGALLAVFRPPDLRLRIEVDSELVADGNHRVLDISIGNGATVGGGVPVNPGADPRVDRWTGWCPSLSGLWRESAMESICCGRVTLRGRTWRIGVEMWCLSRGRRFTSVPMVRCRPDEQPHVAG
jgi:diacylglycerol kinase (ATP)